jgi:opacity protein-like surface antigen
LHATLAQTTARLAKEGYRPVIVPAAAYDDKTVESTVGSGYTFSGSNFGRRYIYDRTVRRLFEWVVIAESFFDECCNGPRTVSFVAGMYFEQSFGVGLELSGGFELIMESVSINATATTGKYIERTFSFDSPGNVKIIGLAVMGSFRYHTTVHVTYFDIWGNYEESDNREYDVDIIDPMRPGVTSLRAYTTHLEAAWFIKDCNEKEKQANPRNTTARLK